MKNAVPNPPPGHTSTMNVAEVREKWNRRYQENLEAGIQPEPNPLALRFSHLVSGGVMLDAACGLGSGIAALLDRVRLAIGVDFSETALRAARGHWGDNPKIQWIQGDLEKMTWIPRSFSAVCAFGFTDWEFLRAVPEIIRPGGVFFYQGFSRRQLDLKPGLDIAWTSTPKEIRGIFPGWEELACEESSGPPWRISFAARRT